MKLSVEEIQNRLIEGNKKYCLFGTYKEDVSEKKRKEKAIGQNPYAVVLTCSDSRIIPEVIFSATFGELFVIRVAGNIVGPHQLASMEYAIEVLGCQLVLVLGHSHCGAVEGAMKGLGKGYLKDLLCDIKRAIEEENSLSKAIEKNILYSVDTIRQSFMDRAGVKVLGGLYDLESGQVSFLTP